MKKESRDRIRKLLPPTDKTGKLENNWNKEWEVFRRMREKKREGPGPDLLFSLSF